MLGSATQETINPEGAVRELARREASRRFLVNYAEYVAAPWYNVQPFHQLIAKKLEDVEFYVAQRGKASRDGRTGIARLMVQMPPQYGKTQLISRFFPSWFLGRNPNFRVVLASYGAELAHENSQHVRDTVAGKEFENIFGAMGTVEEPVDLSPGSQKKSAWDLMAPHRGGLAAAGVGGPLTGKPAHLLIIDDPFKDQEEAESEAYQKTVWGWWSSVAMQRLQPFGAVIVVNTRWDPKDFSGRLLMEMAFNAEADQYDVLSLPAMAPEPNEYAKDEDEQRRALAQGLWLDLKDPLGRKPGEVLWPTHFTPEEVRRRKANTPAHEWLALHMQMPRSRTGGFFDMTKFGDPWPMSRVPADLQWFRCWDLAVSPKKKADSTAGGAIAVDADGNLYIRDVRTWKLPWPQSRKKIIETSDEVDVKEIWGVETVAFQLAAFQELIADKAMLGRAIYPITPEGDKESMAFPLQNRLDLGKVILVDGPWVRTFLDFLMAFPNGPHDDVIDTITKGMQLMREYEGMRRPTGRQLIATV